MPSEVQMLFGGGFSFANFTADVFTVFMFVVWFWLLMTVAGDLFRRSDMSGLAKLVWVVLLIVLPYLGIFAYLLTQGRGMGERNEERTRRAREELRQLAGVSIADEIEKLERLKKTGTISDQEYTRLRAKVMQ